MGKKLKPKKGLFKKGNKASAGKNPKKGYKAYNREERVELELDASMVRRYISRNFTLSPEELERKFYSPNITIFEKRIIGSILGSDPNGVALPFSELVNRIAGKVPDKIEDVTKRDKYADKSLDELMAMKLALAVENQKNLNFLEQARQQQLVGATNVIDVNTHAAKSKTGTGDN